MWEKVTEYLTKWPFLGDFATPNSTQSKGCEGVVYRWEFSKGTIPGVSDEKIDSRRSRTPSFGGKRVKPGLGTFAGFLESGDSGPHSGN